MTTVPVELTPGVISMIVGGFISLVFSIVPGLREKFAGQSKEYKQSVMLFLCILTGITVYALACTPSLGFPFVACPEGGLWSLFSTILLTIVGNVSTYKITPQVESVRQAIDARDKADQTVLMKP